jgi:YidC/Oxa1 family membrane protein insertase
MDFLTNPFIVVMLFLYQLVGSNYVVALILFTVLVRVLTYPLTAVQMKSARRMQELSPKLTRIREKYKNDREKLAQAQMELYKKEGINPAAGCLPLLVQMPILFGLYGAISVTLAATPLQVVDLHHRLGLAPGLANLFPLQNQFLWMNLGLPDPTPVLPILVVATTWLQSKLMTPPTADPKDPSAAMSRQMLIMMPLMVGFFSLTFASGLSIYWVVSNIVGIIQYGMMGRINWRTLSAKPMPAPALVATDDDNDEPVVTAKPVAKPAKRPPTTAPARVGQNGSTVRSSSVPGSGPAPKDRPRITPRKRK